MPRAANLPLLSNEERVVVGTVYKQQGPSEALEQGLVFAGARLAAYVRDATRVAPQRKVRVHCWRGGKRSGALAWLLDFAGFDVTVLEGGYKAYRSLVRDELADAIRLPAELRKKTEVLHALARAGEQVIDLEALAHHRGSAFGGIGQPPQPTHEQFANQLHHELRGFDNTRPVWVENESRRIGVVQLPEEFWLRKVAAHLVVIAPSFEQRVDRLVRTYGKLPLSELEAAFRRLERPLGGLRMQQAVQALARGDLLEVAQIALTYYDATYAFATARQPFCAIQTVPVTSADANVIAAQLLER